MYIAFVLVSLNETLAEQIKRISILDRITSGTIHV